MFLGYASAAPATVNEYKNINMPLHLPTRIRSADSRSMVWEGDILILVEF